MVASDVGRVGVMWLDGAAVCGLTAMVCFDSRPPANRDGAVCCVEKRGS